MSTHNIGFYEEMTKIIFHLSFIYNTYLICSSVSQHVPKFLGQTCDHYFNSMNLLYNKIMKYLT